MRKRIIEGAIHLVEKRGVKFTMDDLAAELGMSKKTIYAVFRDKNSLLIAMVDSVFDLINYEQSLVLKNDELSLVDKIRGVLGVIPEGYHSIDFSQFYVLQDKYPAVYVRVRERLESGWDTTIDLIEEGIAQGIFRPVNYEILKIIYEATTERFIMGNDLERLQMNYMDALDQLVAIIIDGIIDR